jgi:PAS domain S-box-containing protein
MDFLRQLFSSGDFRPHGYCYLWNSGLVWLHLISDLLISLAYFTIPVTLLWFVRKRRDLPFSWMFVMFGVFIVACGATHVMEIWNLWHANYWLAGAIKAVTAAASVGTALLLVALVPRALDLPSLSQWLHANATLQKEIHERRELELDLRISESNYREQAELLDLTHDAISVRSMDNKIHYWNRASERLYGWTKEEARGKTTHALFQTRFPKPLAEIDAELHENGSWEGELIHTRRDGSVITVSSRWALRTDTNGRPLSILESNRDVTQRKREEEKFRNLLESAPDAMVIVNRAGEIRLVNAQTEKLFRYSRDELIGKKVEMLVPQRFLAGRASHRDDYSQSPRPVEMGAGLELYGRRKDGTEFPVEISLSPLETPEGTLVSSAIRDITERHIAEAALRDNEERLKITLEAAQVGSWDLNLLTDTAVRSRRHDEIFGYSSPLPEWGAALFMSHVLPEDRDSVKAGFEEAYLTDKFAIECRIQWPDHSIHWIAAQGRVHRDASGKPVRMRGVVTDISDRKRSEIVLELNRQELAKSNTDLAAVNKELEAFSYSVSHDLRAPLRHIDGFAHILKEEHGAELSSKALRHLDRVIQAAGHMGHLVDDLLNLARIGRKELVRKKIKLDGIVRAAMTDLPDSAGREIEWRIEPLPEASCDPGLLKIVFMNLLSNAVKFTRTRKPAVIEVGSRQANGSLHFFVRDNGVGFDQKYADKLFGVFQRLHSQEEFEGTGVGLATVQRIIHRHGGEIWAESHLDQGTTFYFTLGLPLPPRIENNSPEVKHADVPSS